MAFCVAKGHAAKGSNLLSGQSASRGLEGTEPGMAGATVTAGGAVEGAVIGGVGVGRIDGGWAIATTAAPTSKSPNPTRNRRRRMTSPPGT